MELSPAGTKLMLTEGDESLGFQHLSRPQNKEQMRSSAEAALISLSEESESFNTYALYHQEANYVNKCLQINYEFTDS